MNQTKNRVSLQSNIGPPKRHYPLGENRLTSPQLQTSSKRRRRSAQLSCCALALVLFTVLEVNHQLVILGSVYSIATLATALPTAR
jgi:hypothetical protein